MQTLLYLQEIKYFIALEVIFFIFIDLGLQMLLCYMVYCVVLKSELLVYSPPE